MTKIFIWGMTVVLVILWLGKSFAAETTNDSYRENTRFKVSFTPSQNESQISQGARNLKTNGIKKIQPPRQPSQESSRLKPKHESRLKPRHQDDPGMSRLKPKHKNDRLKPKHPQTTVHPTNLKVQSVSQIGILKAKDK